MKSILSLFLAILCSTCIALAETYTGTTGDCTYELNTEDSTLVISGSGAMADYTTASYVPYYQYAAYVKSIEVKEGVTTIGNYAFYGMTNSTSITLPETILTIGDYAFIGNTSRVSITLPENLTSIGNYAFQANTSLTSINIPASVTTIGNYAFLSCTSLESLTFSEESSLETIGESAFIGCKSISSVALPEGLTTIGAQAFASCTGITSLTLPESLTTIGNAAFASCISITELTLPANLTSIGNSAFSGCSGLKKITNLATTPQTITANDFVPATTYATLYVTSPDYATADNWKDFATIVFFGKCGDNLTFTISPIANPIELVIEGDGAMYDYNKSNPAPWYSLRDSIYTVTMAEGITHIGDSAFFYSVFSEITFPASLESIGKGSFYCSKLTTVNYAEDGNLKSIDDYAFIGSTKYNSIVIPEGVTYIGKYAFSQCSQTTVSIASTVETIDYKAFYWSTRLTSLTFTEPSSLTTIGDSAFFYACYLTSLTLPSGLETIGGGAFGACNQLEELTIPEGVTTIGARAFERCQHLSTLTIPSTVTYIGNYAFKNQGSLTSFVESTGTPTGNLTITVKATTPPTIFECTFSTPAEEYGYLYVPNSDYITTDYWIDFKYIFYIINANVESVTITYGDEAIDVDELVETQVEYIVTYAQVDEDGNIIEDTETSEQPTETGDYVIIYTIEATDATCETVLEIPLTIENKSTDGNGSTGIDETEVTTSVSTIAGGIVIEASEAVTAQVYNLSGTLAAEATVDGTATLSVAKGAYVVVLSNGITTKALVK